MIDRQSSRLVAALFLLVVLAGLGRAEETAPTADEGKRLQAVYLADAKTYEFFADGARTRSLVRSPAPILHWATADDWSGDLFCWTDNGRPEIVGCILSGPFDGGRRPFFHELHSLTVGRSVRQELPEGRTWAPQTAGLVFSPIDDAPLPAADEKSRLAQMRKLAREFATYTRHYDSDWELRLLPQPVFRYQPAPENGSRDWLDGAIFASVLTMGTDAEVLLVLEARPQSGEPRWHSALARMTTRSAWAKRGGREIWRVEARQATPLTDPYVTFAAGRRTAEELKTAAGSLPKNTELPPVSAAAPPP